VSDLDKLDFGLGAAQQERHLGNYFYRSGAFKLACSDKIYLVLGAKGAGKSAIFRMLRELQSEIPIFAPPESLCD
jgi:predicted Ser/Thr protein kinase